MGITAIQEMLWKLNKMKGVQWLLPECPAMAGVGPVHVFPVTYHFLLSLPRPFLVQPKDAGLHALEINSPALISLYLQCSASRKSDQ